MISMHVLITMYLPSPPISGIPIGPVTIHFYALALMTGMATALILSSRRVAARGGNREHFENLAFWAILLGIVGARTYHVITHYQDYFSPGTDPLEVFKVWHGGLAILGGVLFGAVTFAVGARIYKMPFSSIVDCVAPTVLIAQAIGRLGNWFNQELFGLPSELPWAVKIDPAYRPPGYEQAETFHPMFLYEMVWNLLGAAVLFRLEKRFRLGRGKLFICYLMWYTFGRFFLEMVRTDPSNLVLGLRVNSFAAGVVFLAAASALVWALRNRPGVRLLPFGMNGPNGATMITPRPASSTK